MKVFLSLALLFSVVSSEFTPVLLFGKGNIELPVLPLVSSEKFMEIAKIGGDAMNVAFIQKNEHRETFLHCTTETGETCYKGLKTLEDKNYYGKVDSPIETLKNSHEGCTVLNTNEKGELPPIKFKPKSCVIVNLFGSVQDSDNLITRFVKDNKEKKIVTFYTPNYKKIRVTRAVPSPNAIYFANPDPGFAIYYERLQLCIKSKCEDLTSSKLSVPSSNSTAFTVSITTNNPSLITFNIEVDAAGYFKMHSLGLGENKFRIQDVNAPTTFSYFCGNKTFYQYGTETNDLSLVFNSLQIQAPFNKNIPVNDKFAFGDPWHCVPFVSIPILAGLFVVAILLAILSVGICWIMDINTMDRFDDPKGKTITINAQE